jgi:hypothetical protein
VQLVRRIADIDAWTAAVGAGFVVGTRVEPVADPKMGVDV